MSVENELDRLMHAFLAAVSFDPGHTPDYDAIRTLFIVDGMLIRNSGDAPEVTNVDEFIAPRQALVDSGALTAFFEGELDAITEIFGTIAHRFSHYEKRGTQNGSSFEARGAISTQFVRTPNGWRMSSMVWDDER